MKPAQATRTVAAVDARVGGRFDIVMHVPGQSVPHRGVHEAIDRPRRLVFTWNSPCAGDDDSRVTVDLLRRAEGSEVVVTHEKLPTEVAVGQHREGWTDILGSLQAYVSRAS